MRKVNQLRPVMAFILALVLVVSTGASLWVKDVYADTWEEHTEIGIQDQEQKEEEPSSEEEAELEIGKETTIENPEDASDVEEGADSGEEEVTPSMQSEQIMEMSYASINTVNIFVPKDFADLKKAIANAAPGATINISENADQSLSYDDFDKAMGKNLTINGKNTTIEIVDQKKVNNSNCGIHICDKITINDVKFKSNVPSDYFITISSGAEGSVLNNVTVEWIVSGGMGSALHVRDVENISINNFTVADGIKTSNENIGCVTISGANNCKIDGLNIKSASPGIRFETNSKNNSVDFSNVNIPKSSAPVTSANSSITNNGSSVNLVDGYHIGLDLLNSGSFSPTVFFKTVVDVYKNHNRFSGQTFKPSMNASVADINVPGVFYAFYRNDTSGNTIMLNNRDIPSGSVVKLVLVDGATSFSGDIKFNNSRELTIQAVLLDDLEATGDQIKFNGNEIVNSATINQTTLQNFDFSSLGLTKEEFETLTAFNAPEGRTNTTNVFYNVPTVPKPQEYTVTYDANGGVDAPADEKVYDAEEQAAVLPAGSMTRSEYLFTGWNTEADGSGGEYQPGAYITMNQSVTLYAQWKAQTYTLSYAANGGVSAPSDTKAYNAGEQAIVLSPGAMRRLGYNFVGWNTSADGKGKGYQQGSRIQITGNMVLHAQWRRIYVPPIVLPEEPEPTRETQIQASNGIYDISGGVITEAQLKELLSVQATDENGNAIARSQITVGTGLLDEINQRIRSGEVGRVSVTFIAPDGIFATAVLTLVTTESVTDTTEVTETINYVTNEPEVLQNDSTKSNPTNSAATQEKLEQQTGNLIADLADGNVPLGNMGLDGVWSLLNLLMSLVALMLGVIAFVTLINNLRDKKRYEEEEQEEAETLARRYGILKIAVMLSGVIPGILFLILEDLSFPVSFINKWTPLIGLFFIIHVIILIIQLAIRKNEQKEEQDVVYTEA